MFILLMITSSCKISNAPIEEKPEVAVDKMELNQRWELTEINSTTYESNTTSKAIELLVNVLEKKFSGNDGCNQIFGDLDQMDNQNITFGMIGSTRMACQKMELSGIYTQLLKKTVSYSITGLELHLFEDSGEVILKFRQKS